MDVHYRVHIGPSLNTVEDRFRKRVFFILIHYHFTLHVFRVQNPPPPFLKVTSLQTIIVQRHNIFTFSSLNTHRTENSYVRHLYNLNSSTFL